MVDQSTTIINHERNGDVWSIIENDKVLLRNIPSESLAEQLEQFICERDLKWLMQINQLEKEVYASSKLTDFYQELILSTLEDKLSDIDTMYAMKLMLKELTEAFEGLIPVMEKIGEKSKNGGEYENEK